MDNKHTTALPSTAAAASAPSEVSYETGNNNNNNNTNLHILPPSPGGSARPSVRRRLKPVSPVAEKTDKLEKEPENVAPPSSSSSSASAASAAAKTGDTDDDDANPLYHHINPDDLAYSKPQIVGANALPIPADRLVSHPGYQCDCCKTEDVFWGALYGCRECFNLPKSFDYNLCLLCSFKRFTKQYKCPNGHGYNSYYLITEADTDRDALLKQLENDDKQKKSSEKAKADESDADMIDEIEQMFVERKLDDYRALATDAAARQSEAEGMARETFEAFQEAKTTLKQPWNPELVGWVRKIPLTLRKCVRGGLKTLVPRTYLLVVTSKAGRTAISKTDVEQLQLQYRHASQTVDVQRLFLDAAESDLLAKEILPAVDAWNNRDENKLSHDAFIKLKDQYHAALLSWYKLSHLDRDALDDTEEIYHGLLDTLLDATDPLTKRSKLVVADNAEKGSLLLDEAEAAKKRLKDANKLNKEKKDAAIDDFVEAPSDDDDDDDDDDEDGDDGAAEADDAAATEEETLASIPNGFALSDETRVKKEKIEKELEEVKQKNSFRIQPSFFDALDGIDKMLVANPALAEGYKNATAEILSGSTGVAFAHANEFETLEDLQCGMLIAKATARRLEQTDKDSRVAKRAAKGLAPSRNDAANPERISENRVKSFKKRRQDEATKELLAGAVFTPPPPPPPSSSSAASAASAASSYRKRHAVTSDNDGDDDTTLSPSRKKPRTSTAPRSRGDDDSARANSKSRDVCVVSDDDA